MPKHNLFIRPLLSAVLCSTLLLGPLFPWPALALSTLPETFDLRNIDGAAYIGPIKDQHPLGTCYSFATTAVAESAYNLACDNYDGNPVSLSESFIIWSLGQKYAGFPMARFGEENDSSYDELQAMVDYGDCTEKSFPYTSEWDKIKRYDSDVSHDLGYHWDAPRIEFAGWHHLPTNDIETIKRAIMTFGSVFAKVNAATEFIAYTDGIFSDKNTGATNFLEYNSLTNHSISLVGWNDHPSGDGQGYWILRNSWGDDWGKDGYMRIAYTSARVAVSTASLHYKPWEAYEWENFHIVNTGDMLAEVNTTGFQPVARGLYDWGGNEASMVNNGTIKATAEVTGTSPYVHGMFLWAGNAARIENNGIVEATAATDDRQATAYGVCLQGRIMMNTGTISVNATTTGGEQATAYGVRFLSFDRNGTFANTGSITARAGNTNGWAYGLLSTHASEILNTNNITATGNKSAGAIVTDGLGMVNNQGNLVAVTDAPLSDAYGICTLETSVMNTGTILARTEGINDFAFGVKGQKTPSLANEGLITARANGDLGTACAMIGISSKSLSNTETLKAEATMAAGGMNTVNADRVFNSGTVRVAADTSGSSLGVWLQASRTMENTGTINATAAINAIGIRANVQGTDDTNFSIPITYRNSCRITNNGTISAWTKFGLACGVNMDGGTLINQDNGVISAGTKSGLAYGLYLVNSTAYNNGLVQGDTLVGQGSLLGGHGSFSGNVINTAGTVAPGNSIGTLSVNGNYIQKSGATLEIEFNDTASDRLVVNGIANIQGGTLHLVPLGYTNGIDSQFLNATIVNGTFDDIVSPALFAYSLAPNASGIALSVVRNSYVSLGVNEGQQGVAGALDRIRPTATGDMEDILTLLDNTIQASTIRQALTEMTPGMHAAASYASLLNTHRSMGYVRRHWKNLQTEAGRNDTPYEPSAKSVNGTRCNAWGSFVGASSRTKTQDSIPGFNGSMTGLVLGMDYTIGTKLTTGLAGTYTRQSLNQEDRSGSSTIKTFRGYMYGLWDENPEAKGLYVSTALGIGSMHFNTDRDIAFLNREAESDHRGQDYSLLATAGYDIENGNWTLRPSLNLEYIFLHEKSYDESDAGDMNLHNSEHDSQSLQSNLGISIARRCRLKRAVLIPELRIAWTHEFLPEQDDLTSRFLTTGPSFDTSGREIPKDAAVLGLAIKAPLSSTIFTAFDYECTLTEGNESTDHRFDAQVRIRF